jgi:ankyrin repeat protein
MNYEPLAFASASKGNLTFLKLCIQQGVKPFVTREGSTLIHFAAEKGHVTVVEYLRFKGVPLFAKNSEKKSSLHLAAGLCKNNFLKYLLKRSHERELLAKDTLGNVPLHYAAIHGNLENFRTLYEIVGDKIYNHTGRCATQEAIIANQREIIEWCRKK